VQVAAAGSTNIRLVLDHKGRGVMVFHAGSNGLWSSRLADPAGDAWSEPQLAIESRGLVDLIGGPAGRAVLVMVTGDETYSDLRFE